MIKGGGALGNVGVSGRPIRGILCAVGGRDVGLECSFGQREAEIITINGGVFPIITIGNTGSVIHECAYSPCHLMQFAPPASRPASIYVRRKLYVSNLIRRIYFYFLRVY